MDRTEHQNPARPTTDARAGANGVADDVRGDVRGGVVAGAPRGEMARRVGAFDWSATPLGPRDAWPAGLRTAVDICLNSRFPMFVWWGEQLVNVYNDAYAPVLGKRHPAALGRPAREIWQDIWEVVGPQADAVMTRGESTWNERVPLAMERNGYAEETWFTWSYSPIPDDAGRVAGLFCACTEETGRVRAEERVATVLDSIGDGLVTMDRDWRFTYVNPAGERLLGTSAAALIGRSHWEAFPASVGTALEHGYRRAVRERTVVDFENHYAPWDRWFNLRGYPTGDGGLSVYFTDVTEKKRAGEALRDSEEQYRALFDTMDEGFCVIEMVFDAGGRPIDYVIVEMNPAFERHTGLRDMAGRSIRERVPTLDPFWYETYGRIARTGVAERFVSEAKALEDRWFEVYAFRLGGEGSRRVAILFKDITTRKRAEAERERLAELRRAADERARTILESIADGFFALDRDWRFTYVNPQAERVLGRTPDDLIGKLFWDEYGGVRGTEFERIYRRAMTDGHAGSGTLYYPDHDRHYEAHAYPAPDGISVYFRDVSERHRADEALRASQEQRRLALDAAELGAWNINPVTQTLVADARFYELFSGTADPLTYEQAFARVHPDDRARVRAAVDAASRPDDPAPYAEEYRVVHQDGTVRWVFAKGRANIATGADGVRRLASFDGTVADITDRKRADDELRRGRDQMEMVVRGANVGVWYCPLPFDVLHWDDKVKEHFHLAPGDAVTIDTFYDRIHPDDRGRTRAAIERSIASREPYEIDYRTVSVDGARTTWVRATGRTFYDDAGNPTRFDGVTVDVSERRRAEDALREREERYRLALRATSNAVWDWNLLTNHVRWNEALRDLYGHADAAPTGDWWVDHIHPDDRGRIVAGIHAVIDAVGGPTTWQDEYRFARADGTHAEVTDRGYVIRDAAGRAVRMIGAMLDLTEGKRVERERERVLEVERAARSQAELASRMKDEFLATLSHELRTPLNAILGWSQIMRRPAATAADLAQGVDVIERNARAQAQIIEDLLDMSRIISGKIRLDVRRLDLTDVVRGGVEAVRPAAEAKGVRLTSILDPLGAGQVSGDAGRLGQVLWNLLTNALKFTPKGGRVTVELRRVASHVELSVADTGEGIGADFLPFVFDRFRQADSSSTRRFGGLGLGLSIVKQLVELHGGSARVASAGGGRGSTFTVALPLGAALPQPAGVPHAHGNGHGHGDGTAARPSDGQTPDLAGLKVLVVDDEADARALVRRLLEDCAARVTTAGSAAEAVALAAGDRFDVIVSDVGMPGEDGLAMIRRLRATGPASNGDVPAIALTAYARAEDRVRAIRAGFQMHVAKPVEPSELVATVASLARRGRE